MITRALLLTCLFALTATTVARANDWYRWRGPNDDGISTETGWQSKWPDDGPKRLWKVSVGTGFSSMSVSHGKLYTMGNDGENTDTIYCFDTVTGAPVWKHSYPCEVDPKYYEGGPSATPTVDADRVYAISRKGDLFCLDAAKGTVIWSTNVNRDLGFEIPTWGFAGSALVDEDRLILDVGSAGLALNKNTGAVIWQSDKSAPGYSTPVPFDFHGQPAIAINDSASVQVVNRVDGKPIWSFLWKTFYNVNAADPIISGEKMFISSGYGHGSVLLDISKTKPSVIWQTENFRNHINSSVLWKGFLYGVDDVSNSRYELKCVDWNTGEVKWAEPSFGKGSLIIADGKIIGLGGKGELMVVDPTPDGFKPISRVQVLGGKCWTTPVLSNGRIYCRNAKGDLVCLDVSAQ
jgi:outer membrane protein assembly factor BamB